MSKFIEVQIVEQVIRDEVEDNPAVYVMVHPGAKDIKKDEFGLYHYRLSDVQHCTDEAQATDETVVLLESMGYGYIMCYEFDLYTANEKKYISRKEYNDVFLPEQ